MTIEESQQEIIEEFSEMDDWMDRYQLLIDMGEEQAPLPAEEKNESNLIDGCQSRVWIVCDEQDGRLHFRAESDALIVKGIIALLIRVINDHTPQEPNSISSTTLAYASISRLRAPMVCWL